MDTVTEIVHSTNIGVGWLHVPFHLLPFMLFNQQQSKAGHVAARGQDALHRTNLPVILSS